MSSMSNVCHVFVIYKAIDNFARMVKQIPQTLQSFGNELAEEELPNDAQATSYLLATHTERRDKMKVC